MSPSEVLLRAADRVQFGDWTQFTYAQTADGRCVAARHPDAVKWCAKGALKAEARNRYQFGKCVSLVEDDLNQRDRVYHNWTLMTWNDQAGRTAGEVADTMRRIAKELSNGAAA
jgi:hypothetical protein